MAKITGVGGVFFRSKNDAKASMKFYTEKMGINEEWPLGTTFATEEQKANEEHGGVHWSIFAKDNDYFGDTDQQFMINYKVDNLDEYVAELEAKGVEVLPKRMDDKDYGKFAWAIDADGYRIELWEAVK